MNPNRSKRCVHSPEFKAQVLGECRQPGASVAAVAVAHGLNPNLVRQWLDGQSLKRTDAATAETAPRVPSLQLVPVELAKSELARPERQYRFAPDDQLLTVLETL